MNATERSDDELRALLERHPDALVSAIDAGGLFVPIPPTIPLGEHRVPQARSALDLVVPEDRVKVIDAWASARSSGTGRATVRVAGTDGVLGALHLTDVTATHGVYMGVLVILEESSAHADDAAVIVSAPPRLVRTRKDELSVIIDVHPDVTAVLGWTPEELVGRRSLELIHPDDHTDAINTWMEVLEKPGATFRRRLRHLHSDGRWVWLEFANTNRLADPSVGAVECDMLDISEEMDALAAVRASEQLFRRLAAALPVGVVQLGADRQVVYANEELFRIFGVDEGSGLEPLKDCVINRDALRETVEAALRGADADIELHVERADGSGPRQCMLALRALTSPDGTVTGAVGSVTDITDAARMSAELEHRATYDALTGCMNRSTTIATLDEVLSTPGHDTAVMFVDLDGFKAVNDAAGHRCGDSLLVAVAERLQRAVRSGDVVGRIGGDEFLVICPAAGGPSGSLALAQRLIDALADPIVASNGRLCTSASVGVAWTDSEVEGDDLIARADTAMYDAKRAGGSRAVLA